MPEILALAARRPSPAKRALPEAAPRPLVAVSQSVFTRTHGARWDGLERSWTKFFGACGLCPSPLPNERDLASELLRAVPFAGLVLTCGDQLFSHGGNAPERDRTDAALVSLAGELGMPVIAVGRGMQIVQRLAGADLTHVHGHSGRDVPVVINGREARVFADMRFGAMESTPEFSVWARSRAGVVMAIADRSRRLHGLMWRPDLAEPYRSGDLELFARAFGAARPCKAD